jgi:hypothetical protein
VVASLLVIGVWRCWTFIDMRTIWSRTLNLTSRRQCRSFVRFHCRCDSGQSRLSSRSRYCLQRRVWDLSRQSGLDNSTRRCQCYRRIVDSIDTTHTISPVRIDVADFDRYRQDGLIRRCSRTAPTRRSAQSVRAFARIEHFQGGRTAWLALVDVVRDWGYISVIYQSLVSVEAAIDGEALTSL